MPSARGQTWPETRSWRMAGCSNVRMKSRLESDGTEEAGDDGQSSKREQRPKQG